MIFLSQAKFSFSLIAPLIAKLLVKIRFTSFSTNSPLSLAVYPLIFLSRVNDIRLSKQGEKVANALMDKLLEQAISTQNNVNIF